MGRINKELINSSLQFLNPLKEFQLNLRDNKLFDMENLVVTNNQFGCIDLTNNSIIEIPVLPKLDKLRSLLLSNNKINNIQPNFSEYCLNIENLILTNNEICSLKYVEVIAKSCKNLKRLSLVDNIVSKMKNYRLFVIQKIPSLKVLDYQKISYKEREEAKKLVFNHENYLLLNEDIDIILENEKSLQLNIELIKKKNAIIEEIKKASNLDELLKIAKEYKSK